MAVAGLKKPVKPQIKDIDGFINAGGTLAKDIEKKNHRLTLRIPKWLMEKVDIQRKKRVGSISEIFGYLR